MPEKDLSYSKDGDLTVRKLNINGIHVVGRGANQYYKDTKAYYLPGFITKIKHATDRDMDNIYIYASDLLKSFHQLVLPLNFEDRKVTTKPSIFSKELSYYVKVGKLVIGILNISIRNYEKTRREIVYTYRYKTGSQHYYALQDKTLRVKDISKYSKKRQDLLFVNQARQRKKEKRD